MNASHLSQHTAGTALLNVTERGGRGTTECQIVPLQEKESFNSASSLIGK